MKKLSILICLSIVLGISATNTFAQDSEVHPRFVVKTNPFQAMGGPFWMIVVPVTGEYKVNFEMKTFAKQSATLGVSYIGPSLLLNLDDITSSLSDGEGIHTSGFKLAGMYKFYVSRDKEAPDGFYVGLHSSFANAVLSNSSDENDYIQLSKINLNGVLGYQLIGSGGFALDIYSGFGLKVLSGVAYDDGNPTFEEDFVDAMNRTKPVIPFGFSFGFAF